MIQDGKFNKYEDDYDWVFDKIEQDLDWVPSMTFEEYFDDLVDDAEKWVYYHIKDNYMKNKGFKTLMTNYKEQEIMLDCKSYYLINKDWASKILEPFLKS
jgi:hypothetical protein